ncbi:MAG: hypothetical protein HYX21_02935 [Candidatus Yanofskybacteria bacterium]|nr:hypothetical protein [Candidatus Yanofskybacteria bacterium]
MTTNIKQNREFIDLASNLQGFIQKNGWISRYDLESDAFSITTPNLSEDARIRYFDDEIALYVTNDNKIEGIFMEYFKSNFVQHHKDLKPVLENIEKEQGKKEIGLVQLGKDKIQKLAPDIQEALQVLLAEKLNLGLNQAR